MFWPIAIILVVTMLAALFIIYRKDQSSNGYLIDGYCQNCKQKFNGSLVKCPYCYGPNYYFE